MSLKENLCDTYVTINLKGTKYSYSSRTFFHNLEQNLGSQPMTISTHDLPRKLHWDKSVHKAQEEETEKRGAIALRIL